MVQPRSRPATSSLVAARSAAPGSDDAAGAVERAAASAAGERRMECMGENPGERGRDKPLGALSTSGGSNPFRPSSHFQHSRLARSALRRHKKSPAEGAGL